MVFLGLNISNPYPVVFVIKNNFVVGQRMLRFCCLNGSIVQTDYKWIFKKSRYMLHKKINFPLLTSKKCLLASFF